MIRVCKMTYFIRALPACFTIYLSDHLRWRQSSALLLYREMAKGEPKKAGCKHFCFLWTTADVREISTSRRQRESGRESWRKRAEKRVSLSCVKKILSVQTIKMQ